MAIFINDVEIPNSKIAEINNDYLNMEYQKARKDRRVLHIKFKPYDTHTTLKYLEYKGNIAHAMGNKTMIHLWIHHKKYVNGQIFNSNEIIEYILATYDGYLIAEHIDELIAGRKEPLLIPRKPVPSILDIPTDMADYKIDANGNPRGLIRHFKELNINHMVYVPLRPKYIKEINGEYCYTYPQFGDASYTKIYRKEDFANIKSMKKLLIMGNIPELPLATIMPEDIRTWKFGPTVFDLHMMFHSYPYELDISEWNVEHISRIDYAFCNVKFSTDISNVSFHNCSYAVSAFEGTNVSKCPIFRRLSTARNMFNEAPIYDISNIKSQRLSCVNDIVPYGVPIMGCTIYACIGVNTYDNLIYINCKIIIMGNSISVFIARNEGAKFVNCTMIDDHKKITYNS